MITVTRKFILSILFVAALGLPCMAQASIITLEFASVYSGTAPSGSGAWASATFQSEQPGAVLLTLSGLGLTASEFISNWFFNFNPNKSLDGLTFTYQSGVRPDGFAVGDGSQKAGPSKQFDILVSDPTANNGGRFGAGSISTILITGLADLTAEDFAYGNKDGYFGAAHVQAILAGKSGWVSGDVIATKKENVLPTPEPATLTLLGLGSLVGVLARKRSRKSA